MRTWKILVCSKRRPKQKIREKPKRQETDGP